MYLNVNDPTASLVDEVRVDGVVCENVIELDTDQGWVRRYVGPDTLVTLSSGQRGISSYGVATEVVTGEVTVTYQKKESPHPWSPTLTGKLHR